MFTTALTILFPLSFLPSSAISMWWTTLTPSLSRTYRKSWRLSAPCITTTTRASTPVCTSSPPQDTRSNHWTSSPWRSWTAKWVDCHWSPHPCIRSLLCPQIWRFTVHAGVFTSSTPIEERCPKPLCTGAAISWGCFELNYRLKTPSHCRENSHVPGCTWEKANQIV